MAPIPVCALLAVVSPAEAYVIAVRFDLPSPVMCRGEERQADQSMIQPHGRYMLLAGQCHTTT
jgi:hypothetical protein